ncbi:MAG: DUF4115 domain-containing protein [Endomicrobium sp.]|jgi:cytoskeletal protein RodZ|nr:DUF4115 domain-containing protein [Endomicrobium sp.]
MKEIGKTLKERREKKKLTLAQARAATKIQEKYLAALEDGNAKVFSALVYYKSFLKSYAKYLGLNQELILKRYEESNASADALERYDYERSGDFFVKKNHDDKDEENGEELKTGNFEKKHIAAALAVLAVLICAFFYLNSKISDSASEISNGTPPQIETRDASAADLNVSSGSGLFLPEPRINLQNSEVKNETPQIEFAKEETVKTQTPQAESLKNKTVKPEAAKPQGNAKQDASVFAAQPLLELRVEAVENVWVKIDSDGREQFQGTLLKSNSKTFKADDNFSLKIGYTPGIKVFFNNEPIDVVSGSVQDVNAINLKREQK